MVLKVTYRLNCNERMNYINEYQMISGHSYIRKIGLDEAFISYHTFLSSNANQRLLEHLFFLRWDATAVERYKNVKLLKDE